MNDLRDREELARLLSSKLKELMERDRVSLHVLSTRLGINKSTLHNWLNGVVPQPLLALLRVCDFFGITVDELCSERIGVEEIKNEETFAIQLSIQVDALSINSDALRSSKSSFLT